MAEQGKKLFRAHGCSGCHGDNSTVHAPSLAGLYGTYVHLQDGSVRRRRRALTCATASSIRAAIVAGYPPIMPDFSGQISEERPMKLVAYIKSLAGKKETRR